MSYWVVRGRGNVDSYREGLAGIWMTSLLCDLGNGKFDGANLISNFESLNPAKTSTATKTTSFILEIYTEEERTPRPPRSGGRNRR